MLVLVVVLNLFYMILIENRLKKNEKELSNLRNELLKDTWGERGIKRNEDGILIEMLGKLKNIEQKID